MTNPIEEITKVELLAQIRGERARLEQLLDPLTEAQMVAPGVEGDWSIADILAHLSAWERRMVGWVGEALQGQVAGVATMTWEDVERWNAETYEANRDRPLAEVLADFRSSHFSALQVAEAVPEEDLIDPYRFAWRQGRPLWTVVAANTWWHYSDHSEAIALWLANAP